MTLEPMNSNTTGDPAVSDDLVRVVNGRRGWMAGDPCGACGSTDTYGYAGNGGCNSCHAHDQDGG
jgi:hypothetical protein